MSARSAVVTLVITLALGSAPTADAGERQVDVIGDSILRLTYEADGAWRVDARDGRTLHGSQPLIQSTAARHPDAIVIALGTNDVAYDYLLSRMSRDVQRAVHNAGDVPCVVFTTVTPLGTPFYNRHWARAARRFNGILWRSGVNVANWSRAVRENHGLLLADGVHPSNEGALAYDRLLRDAVDQFCPLSG